MYIPTILITIIIHNVCHARDVPDPIVHIVWLPMPIAGQIVEDVLRFVTTGLIKEEDTGTIPVVLYGPTAIIPTIIMAVLQDIRIAAAVGMTPQEIRAIPDTRILAIITPIIATPLPLTIFVIIPTHIIK